MIIKETFNENWVQIAYVLSLLGYFIETSRSGKWEHLKVRFFFSHKSGLKINFLGPKRWLSC